MGSWFHHTEIILAQLVQWFQQTAANSRLYLVIRRGEGLAGWRAALRKCSKLFSESSGDFGQQGELCWARFGQSGDIEHFFWSTGLLRRGVLYLNYALRSMRRREMVEGGRWCQCEDRELTLIGLD